MKIELIILTILAVTFFTVCFIYQIFIICAIIFLILLWGWYAESSQSNWHEYTIRKHRSGIYFRPCKVVTLNRWMVYSDKSWVTTDTFVNKICGFSIGWHHRYSYRFGWRTLNGKIYIVAYVYEMGEFIIKEFFEVSNDQKIKLTIVIIRHMVVMTAETTRSISHTFYAPSFRLGYLLYPYYGGKKEAPHNIEVNMIKL